MRRAAAVVAVGVGVAAMTGCQQAVPAPPDLTSPGAALVSAAVPVPSGGSAWRSAIQAPHFQTDRDVGAAGIANGLLALADVTGDQRERDTYVTAARDAADFLVGSQVGPPGRWPDYRDPGDTAPMAYTSFDDGAAGIADLLWTMWERTGDERYRTASLAGIDWVVDQAEGVDDVDCPQMCRWAWSDHATPSYRNGMGEGQAGIVYALSVFAERTGDARYARYARGGAAYLESLLDDDGGLPESDTEDQRNTGYLSGAAGAAYVFLHLYTSTGDPHWLDVARRPLAFLDATATPAGEGLSWPIMVDDEGWDETNPHRATGMEEGAAGIGWVYLQAHAVTGDPHYLDQARAAGQWLVDVALPEHGGCAWAEYEGSDRVHSGLNSGVAGTGWFLHDLGVATGGAEFGTAAQQARQWLVATAVESQAGSSWYGTRVGTEWTLGGEPSWHWGGAGILAFLARMQGWPVDSPGMQPALPTRQVRGG
ncbi:MAG: lanthionine synthetase LanC family protein [Pseudonocardia sp.]